MGGSLMPVGREPPVTPVAPTVTFQFLFSLKKKILPQHIPLAALTRSFLDDGLFILLFGPTLVYSCSSTFSCILYSGGIVLYT